MKNINSYTVLSILLFSLIYVVGCAPATTAPKDWLPSVSDAQHESYGGWISVRYYTGDSKSEVHGELIAVRANQILILTEQALISISIDSISRMKLTSVQLVGDKDVNKHRQMTYPAKPLNKFRAYARFPQGLSKNFDVQFLKPKRREIKISIPTEALESPQKDQSMPLEDLTQQHLLSMPLGDRTQQHLVRTEAITAAEVDAKTYVNTTEWFLTGFFFFLTDSGRSEPSLPPRRLLGKSPEYVAFYAAAYPVKAKKIQSTYERIGRVTCLAVCLLGPLVLGLTQTE